MDSDCGLTMLPSAKALAAHVRVWLTRSTARVVVGIALLFTIVQAAGLALGLGLGQHVHQDDAQPVSNMKAASSGPLTFRFNAPPSTFDYYTDEPSPKNWIGLYRHGGASGGGPQDEKHVDDALAWAYAPSRQGTVRLSTLSLPAGRYRAYLLADDGYRWLTSPIDISLTTSQGSLSLDQTNNMKAPATFRYATASPNPKNWIGVYYASGGGPDDQEQSSSNSLAWDWAPDSQGTVHIPLSKLQPGRYKAYFLGGDDGYKWLAEPMEVFVPGTGPLAFIASPDVTTANSHEGEPFTASIRGLLANPPDARTSFAKSNASEGADWVQVSGDGTISGTPTPGGGGGAAAWVDVEATASDGSRARLRVTIPVVRAGSPLVSQLRVMSYNLWFGGTQVNDYHNKQVRFLVGSGADLVGLQESTGGHAIRLAQALGWHHWQGSDVGIISRYPIAEVYTPTSRAGAVRIQLGRDKQVILWNAHLGSTPYGPYDFCFDGMDKEAVLTREAASGRTGQMLELTARMKDQLARTDRTPVVFWPTSMYPLLAGLVDSFRAVHADPVVAPGTTWSPIYVDNEGRREPRDRIDFVLHKGLRVLASDTLVVGAPRAEPHHQDNEWTSDHAAVMTTFEVPA
ncbi:exonuclease III [Purpureocillium lavendulum]|uniref:Exonuclease III n=1 Tax=Purpureocillium lavendulum TaxID=1247861 RepID=A0AB34FX89_9HYPO|nr:exonuclease III [Purpureocillium lavendulum]